MLTSILKFPDPDVLFYSRLSSDTGWSSREAGVENQQTHKGCDVTYRRLAALHVVHLPHALYNSLLQGNISTGTKKLVVAATMGMASLFILARHFQRRKGSRRGGQSTQWDKVGALEIPVLTAHKDKEAGSHHRVSPTLCSKNGCTCSTSAHTGPHGEMFGSLPSLASVKSGDSSSSCTCANGSSCWDRPGDEDLCSIFNVPVTTPENLYLMGMELFEEALRRWEQALTFRGRSGDEEELECASVKLGPGDIIAERSVEDLISAEFVHKLQSLVQRAYQLQEEFERAMGVSSETSSHSNIIGSHVEIPVTCRDDLDEEVSCVRDSLSIASNDSFVSAAELAEQHREQRGRISCRVHRTELLQCLGDTDFLAKLHCVRQACQLILCEKSTRTFLAETGKKVLSTILIKACKSPKRFEEVFEEMLVFLEHPEHWENTALELGTRGVKHLNFYDVVLDFILMDSFEDLENPPISIQNVVNNRWLNTSFKETAVASSCWSGLKQKRLHMKVPDGFIAHLYSVCEQISPVLAWGFLRPKTALHHYCCLFKEVVLFFIKDVFDLQKVRYCSVQTLADDMLRLLHHRAELLLSYLGPDAPVHLNTTPLSPPFHLPLPTNLTESRVL
ncbi:hypothetical protein UPYG_G00302900 [Umbra pygmaea]|uniref:Mitoguardin 1 n=1 Tax=Umbra pygmaea TaxID=75934 RepID=A0ABD0W7M5_UMBPY